MPFSAHKVITISKNQTREGSSLSRRACSRSVAGASEQKATAGGFHGILREQMAWMCWDTAFPRTLCSKRGEGKHGTTFFSRFPRSISPFGTGICFRGALSKENEVPKRVSDHKLLLFHTRSTQLFFPITSHDGTFSCISTKKSYAHLQRIGLWQRFVISGKIVGSYHKRSENTACQSLVAPNHYRLSRKRAVLSGKDAGRERCFCNIVQSVIDTSSTRACTVCSAVLMHCAGLKPADMA
jgi:hypothetical protein